MSARNPILIALDLPGMPEALDLARALAPVVGGFKIGSELFTNAGPEIVRQIRATGASVFLDLKFHDIPNTVAKSVVAAVRMNVQMLTVHTSGGATMLAAAENAAEATAKTLGHAAPLVLGVTVLTSLDSNELAQVGVQPNVGHQVERLAQLAVASGLRGLVCSPLEIAALRQLLPRHVALVTPGIRDAGAAADDQKRTLTAAEAMAAGADWLVIGRPIVAAPDPVAAARAILDSIPPSAS
jgi:orotidine-5'-phosphate decarboxylase